MPAIKSEDPSKEAECSAQRMIEEAPVLMKETRLAVQTFDHTIGVQALDVVSFSCSDLLAAYRLSQNLNRTRSGAYKYDPADTVDMHRRLTVNSRKIFEKLSSPRKENKGPYVPNRDIIKLFTNSPEAREREKLAMENEEFLHKHKATYRREGEFFSAQNPDMLEKFQTTHEYIKNVYRHSKDNLIPPGDDIADLHDRVKHFCGVKNEELLEKLRVIEERVRSQEWSGRVKDTKEKMNKLYEENREFLAKMRERQEKKINDLLEDNKDLIENIKAKAKVVEETIEIKGREFDQMMEKTVCDAI